MPALEVKQTWQGSDATSGYAHFGSRAPLREELR